MNTSATWSSWAAFVAMGGYGMYVWGSFGMYAVVLILETVLLKFRRRALKDDLDGASSGIRESGA